MRSDDKAPLQNLSIWNSVWNITETQKLSFQKIKKLITECPMMELFDPQLPTKTLYDASCICLGTVKNILLTMY